MTAAGRRVKVLPATLTATDARIGTISVCHEDCPFGHDARQQAFMTGSSCSHHCWCFAIPSRAMRYPSRICRLVVIAIYSHAANHFHENWGSVSSVAGHNEIEWLIRPFTIEREANSWTVDMKALLVGVGLAALVLVITQAQDIADAAEFKPFVKPVIRTPRIIVRPPNLKPPTKRLIKKNTVEEVTNPTATQGGSAPEADSPVHRRTPGPLRTRSRATAPIPRARPPDDFFTKLGALQAKFPHGNLNELVFVVMRDALKEMNEDKKYFLQKLRDYNNMGEALSDYLSGLSDLELEAAQAEIDSAMAEQKEDEAKQNLDVTRDFIKDVLEKLEAMKREESRSQSALSGIND